MSNTCFLFRHKFLLYARSSQSHATSCASLMSDNRDSNKWNGVKERRWRWLIYALHNFLLRYNVTRFQKETPLLASHFHCCESFTNYIGNTCIGVPFLKSCTPADLFHVCLSLYLIIHVNYVKSYCLYKSVSK